MNSKRKIEINIVEVQTYKILIQINSNIYFVVSCFFVSKPINQSETIHIPYLNNIETNWFFQTE